MTIRNAFLATAGLLAALLHSAALGQELEPRSYINIPTGMNFLIAGGAYQDGDMLFDPSLLAEDARTRAKHLAMGYLRSFGLLGKSAKIAVAGTYTELSAKGTIDGEAQARDDQGFTDPGIKLSVNLLGSPALTLAEFKNYDKEKLILGLGLGLTVPVGEYDPDKLINLGFNRWAVKPEIGVSKMFDRWILEGSLAMTFFGDNTDFNGGKTREQEPLGSAQFHIVYRIKPGAGFWVALDATRFQGGQTTVDGTTLDDELRNNRFGATLALPINRKNSLKIYASTGVDSRRGTEYDLLGVAWQYRWGGGL